MEYGYGYCSKCGIKRNKFNVYDCGNLYSLKCKCGNEYAEFCKECVKEIDDLSDPKYYTYCSECGEKLS